MHYQDLNPIYEQSKLVNFLDMFQTYNVRYSLLWEPLHVEHAIMFYFKGKPLTLTLTLTLILTQSLSGERNEFNDYFQKHYFPMNCYSMDYLVGRYHGHPSGYGSWANVNANVLFMSYYENKTVFDNNFRL